MSYLVRIKEKLTSFQIITLGFVGVILLGTMLLMLPISSQTGEVTSFGNALFTATSAVCVTGLVVYDFNTDTSWWTRSYLCSFISFYDCRKKNQFNATSDHAKCTRSTTGWWCCQADTISFCYFICN